jgi:hypothetical protein
MNTIRKTRNVRNSSTKKKVIKKTLSYEELFPFKDDVYYINGDGATPFRVILKKNVAYIDKNIFNDEDDFPEWKPLRKIAYKKEFIGCDNETNKGNPKYFGNTILLQISPQRYVFIGTEIFEFKSKDQIQSFESPINYPYAYTKDKTYLIWDKSYFPTMYGKDPAEAEFAHEKEKKGVIQKMDVKMIYSKDY